MAGGGREDAAPEGPAKSGAGDPWTRALPAADPMDLSPWSDTPAPEGDGTEGGDGVERTEATDDTGERGPDEVWLRLDLALPAVAAGAGSPADDTPEPAPDDDPPAPAGDDASPFAATEAAPPGPVAAPVDDTVLPAAPGAGAGFFGKLPLRGDFIARGLPRAVLRPLENWLEALMAGLRTEGGPAWQGNYDAAAIWHFWIGPAVFGTTLTGALMPSADRVGRRFPALVVLADPEGEAPPRCPPPPMIAPRPAWHDACAALLRAGRAQSDLAAFEGALDRLGLPQPADPGTAGLLAAPPRALWAQAAPGTAIDDLMADVRGTEAHLAAAARSYWWTGHPADGGAPAMIALEGVPDARVFAFLLQAAPMQPLANGDQSA